MAKLETPIRLVKEVVEIKKSAEEQIHNLFLDSPLDNHPAQHEIVIDSKIHRFNSDTKKGKKNGWYIFSRDADCVHGSFGCWKRDFTFNFKEDTGKNLTHEQIAEIEIKRAVLEGEKAALKARQDEIARKSADKIWESCEEAKEHSYLTKKRIEAHDCRLTVGDGRLVIPMFDTNLKLAGLQYIDSNSEKRFLGSQQNKIHCVGDPSNSDLCYIAEGYATAATIYEQTKKACFVAFNADNLINATRIIKHNFKDLKIINVADNDKAGLRMIDALNVEEIDSILIPIEGMDANDYYCAGKDLKGLLDGVGQPRNPMGLTSLKDLKKNRKPIRWLVKNWLQRKALVMIHGPSGAGKSYAVLDLCMRLSTPGFDDWAGNTVKNGNVVYLAGEGNEGLSIRAEAWETKFKKEEVDSNLWISDRGCGLNTTTGYSEVVESLDKSGISPDLIVVDTLHRFLEGDENSSKDAATMIAACDKLKNDYDCTVILVHHTGNSLETQHRARGSTSWKAAMDGEISIKPIGDGQIELIQRKNKELGKSVEPVLMEFESVEIPFFFDEDGEVVSSSILNVAGNQNKRERKTKDKKLVEYSQILLDAALEIAEPERGDDGLINGYVMQSGAIIDYLVAEGYAGSASVARNMTSPRGTKMFGMLSSSGIVTQPKKRYWRIIDQEIITQINLAKQSK